MPEHDLKDWALSILQERDDKKLTDAFEGDGLINAEKSASEFLPEIVARFNELKTTGKSDASIFCIMLTEIHIKAEIVRGVADDRRREIEYRLQQLEARPAFKYLGVYRPGEVYMEGNFVTDSGSVWHAQCSTMARPGTSEEWVLAVKRGRDGK